MKRPMAGITDHGEMRLGEGTGDVRWTLQEGSINGWGLTPGVSSGL